LDRDTARQTAYEAYHALLTTLVKRFRTALKQDFTPNELANELRDAGKAHLAPPVHLRSRAQHWTDWVSDKKKDQIMLMFNSIPHRAKARIKTPFTRDIPTEEGESE
jgi:dienelactone hydrolase